MTDSTESDSGSNVDTCVLESVPITYNYKWAPQAVITRKPLNSDFSAFEITEAKEIEGGPGSSGPVKDDPQNPVLQALEGTKWTFPKETTMFGVHPPRVRGSESAVLILLSLNSNFSAEGKVVATVVSKLQDSNQFHLSQEEIPLDGYSEWVTAEKASPFHGKSPMFGPSSDLPKINPRLGPKFAEGSIWAKEHELVNQLHAPYLERPSYKDICNTWEPINSEGRFKNAFNVTATQPLGTREIYPYPSDNTQGGVRNPSDRRDLKERLNPSLVGRFYDRVRGLDKSIFVLTWMEPASDSEVSTTARASGV